MFRIMIEVVDERDNLSMGGYMSHLYEDKEKALEDYNKALEGLLSTFNRSMPMKDHC